MKPFQFKEFSISQSKNVFRVGTDGVLLGVAATVEGAKNILEIGTGTGLISLMLAQRNPQATIQSIDINKEAADLANSNFQNSHFKERLRAYHVDFKEFKSNEKFDLIVSNPPYFEENPSGKDILARQQKELSFQILIENAAAFLSENGLLSVIIPFESTTDFENKALESNLFLHRKKIIFGMLHSKAKRVILEFGFQKRDIKYSELVIEKAPRIFTEQYLDLTKNFHQFSK